MPGSVRLALAVTAAFVLFNPSPAAALDVEGRRVTLRWAPSSGSVAMYAVHVARNGASFTDEAESYVADPQVTLRAGIGDTIRVRVVACAGSGNCSRPSPTSERVRFVRSSSSSSSSSGDSSGSSGSSSSGDSSGSSSGSTSSSSGSSRGAAPYDFNGDGHTDLLWLNTRSGEIAVWLMDGTSPSRIDEIGTLASGWRFVGSGDFDRDGYADLLLQRDGTTRYEIWFMRRTTVRREVSLSGPGDSTGVDAIGDFDGDGYADLLWRTRRESRVWFMRGASADDEVVGPLAPGDPVCAPDLDDNGRSDMLWRRSGETIAWMRVGSRSPRPEEAAPWLRAGLWFGCGDADGDGSGDVLWFHQRHGMHLWAMNGRVAVDRSFELPKLGAGWVPEASGDFDGDGLENEILLRNTSSGAIEVWELRWNSRRTRFTVATRGRAGMGSRYWQVVAP